MAFKEFEIEGLGKVTVYKRRGSRSLRLSIQPDGSLRVSIPTWTPYATGVTFARSKQTWIAKQAITVAEPLRTGKLIGKAHRLLFLRSLDSRNVSTRLRQNEVVITHPAALEYDDPSVQTAAKRAGARALRAEADQLLPLRLAALAKKHGFTYGNVSSKPLKTRWGSCDQDQNITFNIYLMQLPWHLIDYVILHELTHTRIMRHGPPFWDAMRQMLPNVDDLRKEMRGYKSTLNQ
jgi:predicted metal-dependent hydrolase